MQQEEAGGRAEHSVRPGTERAHPPARHRPLARATQVPGTSSNRRQQHKQKQKQEQQPASSF